MAVLPSTHPRCLSGFRLKQVTPSDAGLPADVSFNSYELLCPCGHNIWRVLGNWFNDTSEFIGPLFAKCSECESRLRLIDLEKDGYNAEIGDRIPDNETAPNDTWSCQDCGSSEGHLIASFGYQFEPDDKVAKQWENYFDAYILTHNCLDSGKPVQVTVFECA